MIGKVALAALVIAWTFRVSPAEEASKLKAQIQKIAAAFAGDMGVATKNIETGDTVGVNANDLFPMASTRKVAIMAEVFKQAEEGKFSLKDRVELREEHRRPGSGLFTAFDPGLRPTIHDLVLMMMAISDNTAADSLLKRVGAANVTASMRAAGLKAIRHDRGSREMIGDYNATLDPRLRTATGEEAARIRAALRPEQVLEANAAFARVQKDVTTPADMTELLAKIFKGEIVSKRACEQMMEILSHNQIRTRLQRYLPSEGRIYSKYGSLGGSLNDVGIMFVGRQHVAISVYIKNSRIDGYLAEDAIGRVARAVYDYYLYTQ